MAPSGPTAPLDHCRPAVLQSRLLQEILSESQDQISVYGWHSMMANTCNRHFPRQRYTYPNCT